MNAASMKMNSASIRLDPKLSLPQRFFRQRSGTVLIHARPITTPLSRSEYQIVSTRDDHVGTAALGCPAELSSAAHTDLKDQLRRGLLKNEKADSSRAKSPLGMTEIGSKPT
jgi:hypothetical protein